MKVNDTLAMDKFIHYRLLGVDDLNEVMGSLDGVVEHGCFILESTDEIDEEFERVLMKFFKKILEQESQTMKDKHSAVITAITKKFNTFLTVNKNAFIHAVLRDERLKIDFYILTDTLEFPEMNFPFSITN